MILTIASILDETEVSSVRASIAAAEDMFVDGKSTTGWYVRDIKSNQQVNPDKSVAILGSVEAALAKNAVFKSAALPKQFVRMLVSRYRPGMHYGTHVDDVLMNGVRTDLSFTLFLSPLETYDGGSLVIEGNDAEQEIRLPPGSMVIYPTTSLHRVEEVTRGERLAVVGWVRSYVRDPAQPRNPLRPRKCHRRAPRIGQPPRNHRPAVQGPRQPAAHVG